MLMEQTNTANPFPVKFSHRKIPVMKTGFSLCNFSHGENLFPSPGKPVSKTGFPCVGKVYRENPVLSLYWPCTGPVRDCSVAVIHLQRLKILMLLQKLFHPMVLCFDGCENEWL